jgi:hypothetical protein
MSAMSTYQQEPVHCIKALQQLRRLVQAPGPALAAMEMEARVVVAKGVLAAVAVVALEMAAAAEVTVVAATAEETLAVMGMEASVEAI